MTTILRLRTPSRLHFGLLARGPVAPRQFGGVGLMIEAPGLEISAEPAESWGASGPLADRAVRVAGRVAESLAGAGVAVAPARFTIQSAPPEHVGLGTGTQLSLAVARLLDALNGRSDRPVADLARLAGRGPRSGIGLHGFERGGLIVDGGHRADGDLPPLLCRHDLPDSWSVLVVVPPAGPGLHGLDEARAFARLGAIPEAVTDRLCRLVLLGLLPAVAEADLDAFGAALVEIQEAVGRWFAPAQGGLFAGSEVAALAGALRDAGLRGVGQSSWGPALYAFSDAPAADRDALSSRIAARFGLGPDALRWTRASARGAILGPS